MFGSLGGAELLFILVLALLLFGPRKLPQLGRSLGRALAEFRSTSYEFRSNLEREVELDRLKETRSELSATAREITHGMRGAAAAAGRSTPGAAAIPPARPEGESEADPRPRPADDEAATES